MNEKLPSPHQLMLQERETLNVSGVEDEESFDETMVVMSTSRGNLTVRGEGLHMEKLSLEIGEVLLKGEIQSLEYDDTVRSRGGLLSRLFG